MTPLVQWLMLLISGGGLASIIKAVLMTGRVLQKIEDHDTAIKDHASRLINIENWFAGSMGSMPIPIHRRGDNGAHHQ